MSTNMIAVERRGYGLCSRCRARDRRSRTGYCRPCHAAWMREKRATPAKAAENARARERYWREKAERLEAAWDAFALEVGL